MRVDRLPSRVRTQGASVPVEVHDRRGFFAALIGDGRSLLAFTGRVLILSGAFALFLSARGEFLPHDVAALGRTADDLCAEADCRIVRFMFHDRVAFGGALIAVGTLYLWLIAFPLTQGEAWAWWTLALSGIAGFTSFLTYLGYGYLDSWHGAATVVLSPPSRLGWFEPGGSSEIQRMSGHSSSRVSTRPAPRATVSVADCSWSRRRG